MTPAAVTLRPLLDTTVTNFTGPVLLATVIVPGAKVLDADMVVVRMWETSGIELPATATATATATTRVYSV